MLNVTDVSKSYGSLRAVDGLSFRVEKGEIFGFLGPNGAGKTTALSMMAGLLRPDSGSIGAGGFDIERDARKAKSLLGLCPQDIALYEDLSAETNLRFFGSLYGLKGEALAGRCSELLSFLGLADRAADRVAAFSGGMKRRLNLAAALVHDPPVLLLDEPTAGVDPQSRNAIFGAIETLRDQGRAVVYTTHYMEEAERLCDRIAILDRGRMLAQGSFAELLAIVGSRDTIEVRVTETTAATLGAAAEDLAGLGLDASCDGDCLRVLAASSGPALTQVSDALGRAGAVLVSADVRRPTLESVFLHLTGRRLRD